VSNNCIEVDSRVNVAYGLVIVALGLSCLVVSAHAQDAARFYQGKTVTIGVGAAPGGGLDTYARLIARYLGKYVPGAPSIIVSNMPGAGGQVVARHLYASAPKDGTSLATFFPSVLVDPLLSAGARAIDPNRFLYVGNAREETSVCMLRRDAPVVTLADLRTSEVVIGATSPGSQVVDYPVVESRLLGLKLKVTAGYVGTREIAAAVEKGEVQGICGIGWTSIKVQYPDITTPDSRYRVLVQEDAKGDPELNKAGVPLMTSLAATPLDRAVLDLLYAQNLLARPYVLPPGVPADRVEALREAFLRATADPELQAEAARMRIEVTGTSGAGMQTLVASMYETPKATLDRLAELLQRER
jgi:tripartite-type tricarboxylate transporter receptor subunit TctC